MQQVEGELNMDKLDSKLLQEIADLHEIPQGAYNIRKNGELVARNNVAGIEIVTKQDKPGIDIYIKDNTKNQSLHIPVIVTQQGLNDLVYNDFYIGKDCDVVIVAGCGVHNDGNTANGHDGIHTFFIGENSHVKYIEKHLGTGSEKAEKILNPTTVLHLSKGAVIKMETIQLGGVSASKRKTIAEVLDDAVLEINESILTEFAQTATTEFEVNLNGANSRVNVVSRSVAKGTSKQSFVSAVNGNNKCFGHVECDAIVMDKAQVMSTPALQNTDADANLTHEAAIGKIAGEQLIKLQTLGLTQEQAENVIIKAFLKK